MSFELDVDSRGMVTRLEVSSTDEDVRPCIDQVFGWLRFPAPHPVPGRHGPIRVKGTLRADVER